MLQNSKQNASGGTGLQASGFELFITSNDKLQYLMRDSMFSRLWRQNSARWL